VIRQHRQPWVLHGCYRFINANVKPTRFAAIQAEENWFDGVQSITG
jgi:hypothetical protein